MRAARKRTHWMWFVFPQLAGLGHSAMARRYAILGREAAGPDVLGFWNSIVPLFKQRTLTSKWPLR